MSPRHKAERCIQIHQCQITAHMPLHINVTRCHLQSWLIGAEIDKCVGPEDNIISDTYFLVGSEIDVKSIFDRPTKCACTMPIVVPDEIFLLALHPPLARRYVRSRRQLLCPTKCAFPHCSSTRPAKCASITIQTQSKIIRHNISW